MAGEPRPPHPWPRPPSCARPLGQTASSAARRLPVGSPRARGPSASDPLLPSPVSCAQSGRPWGRGAPLHGHSPLCCAPPLWHVRGLLKERSAPRRPSFQHVSWVPVLYPPRSGPLLHLSLSPCAPGIALLLTHPAHLPLTHTHSQAHGR